MGQFLLVAGADLINTPNYLLGVPNSLLHTITPYTCTRTHTNRLHERFRPEAQIPAAVGRVGDAAKGSSPPGPPGPKHERKSRLEGRC